MQTMENYLTYTTVQWVTVSSILTLGAASMAAGMVYFIFDYFRVSPRYRLSSALSAVVMISAFLELSVLAFNWHDTFVFTGEVWKQGDSTFTNAFRYMNWSIDVPVLLTQLLVVLGFRGKDFTSPWVKFLVAGLLMIWTGFVGQFYESAPILPEVNIAPFWIWGGVSTLFFIYILYLVPKVIADGNKNLSEPVQGVMKKTRNLLVISWCLYVIGYLVPIFAFSAWGVVMRTIIYTVADVSSKVIYGVVLGYAAQLRSKEEGLQA